jgi:signal transduction histidine kinase
MMPAAEQDPADPAGSAARHLREVAELRVEKSPFTASSALPPPDLVHELRVHQIELELQNETLRNVQTALERQRDAYIDLYEFAPVGYLSLTLDGMIRKLNMTSAQMLGMMRHPVTRKRFASFVDLDDRMRWTQQLLRLKAHEDRGDLELTMRAADGSLFRAHLQCVRRQSEPDCVERLLLGEAAQAGEVRVAMTDITTRDEQLRERSEHAERVAELSRRLLTSQEALRHRLARELHEETSPTLAAVIINLEVAEMALAANDCATVAKRLADSRELLIGTTASLGEIGNALRPPVLAQAGLLPAMRAYAEQMAWRTGCAVRIECAHDELLLAHDLETTLFRIFQEALTNVARHASATEIGVTIRLAGSLLTLRIDDNGDGFVPEQRDPTRGMGLLNMREMAELSSGRFSLQSTPGKGTQVLVEVDLQAAAGRSVGCGE